MDVRFVKGHGTENDFVLIPPGELDGDIGAALVRRLCDRRRGIGADGVLAVRPPHPGVDADWFMDYRNADGSVAEMCGNGVRVFARYLVDSGLAAPGRMRVETRAGMRLVDVPPAGDVTVDMGSADRAPDAKVSIGATVYDAAGWSMGNPHLVVLDVERLADLDLTTAPGVDPPDAHPDGVNVEVVERLGARHVRMRVHERGVGETRSCGTGACAAAVAAMDRAGERTSYDVDVPGGRLVVTWQDDGTVLLTGPAVLVASGEVALD